MVAYIEVVRGEKAKMVSAFTGSDDETLKSE
jgi:hypothetical protein